MAAPSGSAVLCQDDHMSLGPIEELTVAYDPGPTADRIQHYKRMFRSRLVSFGISCLILIAVFIWQSDRFVGSVSVYVVYGLILLSSIAWVVVTYALYRNAQTAAATLGEGIAVRIDRAGVELAGTRVGWPEVTGIAAVKGKLATGPVLQVTRSSGAPLTVPLSQLSTVPATLDTAARAFSGGRHGVDLSQLDN